ncbi:MAG TPA: 2OG-Fe(II) oxygenase, partial [Flavisolibacter sp.]
MPDFKKQVLLVLEKINSSGSFVSAGTKPFCFPGLKVKDMDEISFPVNVVQVKELIAQAHKAPFGKGSQTVLDTTVRSAWEIDATDIQLTNPEWNGFVRSIVEKAKSEMGIIDRKASANLYKLLIYEKGDFFLPHKDSEKEPGMFGTLIIGLPSKHEGGELLVHFDGNTRIIDFSHPANQYEISYAAFYADCEHEIKPVISGYRLCLVYNLVLQERKDGIQLQQLSNYTDQLVGILKSAEEDRDMPKVVLLGHQYTPANFTMDSLKLNDRPRAEALLRAAELAGFYAKPGLVTSYQMGELLFESRPYR